MTTPAKWKALRRKGPEVAADEVTQIREGGVVDGVGGNELLVPPLAPDAARKEATMSACTCWLGTTSTFGSTAEREACAVHGLAAPTPSGPAADEAVDGEIQDAAVLLDRLLSPCPIDDSGQDHNWRACPTCRTFHDARWDKDSLAHRLLKKAVVGLRRLREAERDRVPTYYAQALDLVAEKLQDNPPAAQLPKLVAVVRNAAEELRRQQSALDRLRAEAAARSRGGA